MTAPLTVKFATDTSAAKSGMADLAGAVVSNMARMGSSMNTAIQANGGYQKSVQTLAQNVGKDFLSVSNATLKAANDSNLSAVAIGTAFGKAAAETKTASVVMTGATAVASANIAAGYAIIKNEVMQTTSLILRSSTAMAAIAVAATAFAAFKFVTAAVEQANNQLDKLIKLGSDAEKANVGAEFFQRFTDAAKAAKLSTDEVAASLKQARDAVKQVPGGESNPVRQKIAGYLETSYTGKAEQAFNSPQMFDVAKNDEERIRAAVEAMKELQAIGLRVEAIDLANTVFGPEIARNLENAKITLDDIANQLDRPRPDLFDLGRTVEQAQDFRDRLSEAYDNIDKALHISVGLESYGRGILDAWLGIAEATAAAANAVGPFLEKMQTAVGYLEKVRTFTTGLVGGGVLGNYLIDKINPNRGETRYNGPIGPGLPGMPGGVPINPPMPPRRPLSTVQNDIKEAGAKKAGGGSASESKDQLETFIDQLNKSAEAIKAETDAFGKNNAEKTASINLSKARATAEANGLTLTDAQVTRINALSVAIANAKDRLKDLEEQQRRNKEAWDYFGTSASDALGSIIFDGTKASQVISNLFKTLGKESLNGLFTGKGVFGTLFGTATKGSDDSGSGGLTGFVRSLFGGMGSSSGSGVNVGFQGWAPTFAAGGGDVIKGRPVTVGEMGTETFVPDSNGRIIPNARGGAMGGSTDNSIYAPVYAPGAQLGAAEEISRMMDGKLANFRREQQRNGASTVRSSDKRYR